MGAARDVDARDEREEPLVVAHRPGPDALADVGVEIDPHDRALRSAPYGLGLAAGVAAAGGAATDGGALGGALGGSVGGCVGGSVGGWVGGCVISGVGVGAADGDSDGGSDGEAVGQGTSGAALPDADGFGVGNSNDGMTPLASGVGNAKQVATGDGAEQPRPSTNGPHDLPYGVNLPL
jgi:hypothetical protein